MGSDPCPAFLFFTFYVFGIILYYERRGEKMGRLKTVPVLSTITDKEDFNRCYDEFKEHFHNDPKLILKLRDVLKPLESGHYYPFSLYQSANDLLPKMFGNNGTRYLIHILRNGIVDEKMNENGSEIDHEIYIELSSLIYQFGIPFMCAEKFINNPLDFVSMQMGYTNDSTENFIRIIRADQKSFEMKLDVDTMLKIAQDMVEKVNALIRQKKIEPDEDRSVHLMGTVYEFMALSGIIPDGGIENGENE